MNEREETRQRSIRLPLSTWEWIDALPPEYGKDATAKIYSVLHRGKRIVEKEMVMWEDNDNGPMSNAKKQTS